MLRFVVADDSPEECRTVAISPAAGEGNTDEKLNQVINVKNHYEGRETIG